MIIVNIDFLVQTLCYTSLVLFSTLFWKDMLCNYQYSPQTQLVRAGIQYYNYTVLYTYISIALFQCIVYPDNLKLSIFTTWTFPLSVPTKSHFDEKGRCIQVNL